MIYLDASAIITLVSGRSYATELRDFLAGYPGLPMGTSTLGFVETVRTLDRMGDFPDAMTDLVRSFTEILLTEEVRDAAASLPTGLRTLDAIHVASAQIIGPALTTLVTYDKRMLDVAHSVGLPCSAPGLDERQS
ncbi:type II toxin-antitoxin system VapC family toxin [Micromonospora sp. WMMD1155]|uniref:type II toxin-antitoxin system VapC family toxin n=1 Tax=Micromonospora sp. WMMD1155 TaxID=3016094 RepID=UPI00249AD733|nr:type II toxin-antitoxin system VapC family toxin [Micromonospora sp. WMMD1155]WFE52351.1 type II toxin-antitoxin system VapC family toxin [Micromonospora sp. WMMD1155]